MTEPAPPPSFPEPEPEREPEEEKEKQRPAAAKKLPGLTLDFTEPFCLVPREIGIFNVTYLVKQNEGQAGKEGQEPGPLMQHGWQVQTHYSYVKTVFRALGRTAVPLVLGGIVGYLDQRMETKTTQPTEKKRSSSGRLAGAAGAHLLIAGGVNIVTQLFEDSQPEYTLTYHGVAQASAKSKKIGDSFMVRIETADKRASCTIQFGAQPESELEELEETVVRDTHGNRWTLPDRPSLKKPVDEPLCGWLVSLSTNTLDRKRIKLAGQTVKMFDIYHSRKYCLRRDLKEPNFLPAPLMALLVFYWERNGTTALAGAIALSPAFSLVGHVLGRKVHETLHG